MASSSHQVFPSFSGKDVRKKFLSHFLRELELKGIETFIDNRIEKGETIGPELVRAIKESRVSIVVISKNYASSSWCLNELLEIMKCRDTFGQKVMTIFFEVDPSDVRQQTGEFGKNFKKTCSGKKEEKQRWRQALTALANIAGEDSRKWPTEAEMVKKIARDVLKELNSTPSKDFDNLVGMEAHITTVKSLLCLRSDEVRMVGIWGHSGIGKTTIARALYNRFSSEFHLCCFMENVKGSFKSTCSGDNYALQLHLQERFLSEILHQEGIRVSHLGVLQERLKGRRVLVVLDDVEDIEQLKALADNTQWFGPGSRIIVTTKDRQVLRVHDINHVYEVNFPSRGEALQIFCQYAFEENSPLPGLEELAIEVVKLSGHLPLGLRVLGSSLKRKTKSEWRLELARFRTSLNGRIEETLRVSYDGLDDPNKDLFICIACLFNGEDHYLVMQLLANSNLSVECGLRDLEDRSLLHISATKQIVMHDLLQQMGREIVRRQSVDEPGKRKYLVDVEDIRDVFADDTGTGAILGISLNMSDIDELHIKEKAFHGMKNLQLLRFYTNRFDRKIKLHLPEAFDSFPRKLRLLHWDSCSVRCFPSNFRAEYLVQLTMQNSGLEKLWDGNLPLKNLKKMDLSKSKNLKEIPDLSDARNVEMLVLSHCESLVTLPSSIGNLNKMTMLDMQYCRKLEALPTNIDLESLDILNMEGCSQLKTFPEISQNVVHLNLCNTTIEEVPPSLACWSRLDSLLMSRCRNLKKFPPIPYSVRVLDLSRTRIQIVPSWIDDLSRLHILFMRSCKELTNISSSISNLEHLAVLDFSYCYNLVPLPRETMEQITCSLRAIFPFGELHL